MPIPIGIEDWGIHNGVCKVVGAQLLSSWDSITICAPFTIKIKL